MLVKSSGKGKLGNISKLNRYRVHSLSLSDVHDSCQLLDFERLRGRLEFALSNGFDKMAEPKQEESNGKTAAKLAAVAAGGSAKDVEKESAAARVLGAGRKMAAHWRIRKCALTQCRLGWCCRTLGLTPCGYHRQTTYVQ